MRGNSFGRVLVLTTFGESHGPATGGILDGYPAGILIDPGFIQQELDRRKPGSGIWASERNEKDIPEILSGIYEGRSTGAPIAFFVRNADHRPADYDHLKEVYRPSHADFTWEKKFGFRDPGGGGRSSARETLARVVGGAFAKILLNLHGITVKAHVSAIGIHQLPEPETGEQVAFPPEIIGFLNEIRQAGDTVGGMVSCRISGVPAGVGEPVFGKLQADLASAMMGINAARGFEYGSGFAAAAMKGSEHNDLFVNDHGVIRTATNHSGGIQGGISNGMDIVFRMAFKPVSTLMREQQSVDKQGNPVMIKGGGRHDVCVVPRALPIVEAMAALVVADHLILSGTNKAPKA